MTLGMLVRIPTLALSFLFAMGLGWTMYELLVRWKYLSLMKDSLVVKQSENFIGGEKKNV